MDNGDPRETIEQSPLSALQVFAIATCFLIFAIDGFDVLAISFAAPGIAADWGISRSVLGIVLSVELFGMAAGSLLLGGVADRFGRRPVLLACLAMMTAGMALAATSANVGILSAWRLLTGIGVGGALAAVNALGAEFTNLRRRPMVVAIMAAGYPVGAIVGGSVASMLLASFDWRSVFILGALSTLALAPIVYFALPESIEFLIERRQRAALAKVNALLSRMKHPTVATLPAPRSRQRSGLAALFSAPVWRVTALITIAYFAHIMTFYFILKWIPKIVVDMGAAPSSAGGVLVFVNIGGALGALAFSFLTQRVPLRALVIAAMALSATLVIVFGAAGSSIARLSMVAAIAGACTNSAVVGLYALTAKSFPSTLRATGTGFVIGVGRGGAAMGPIVAGFLFDAGIGLQGVALAMAAGSALGALALVAFPRAESVTR